MPATRQAQPASGKDSSAASLLAGSTETALYPIEPVAEGILFPNSSRMEARARADDASSRFANREKRTGDSLVVMYHYVREKDSAQSGIKGITPRELGSQLDGLCEGFEPWDGFRLHEWLQSGQRSYAPGFVATFDDGLADHKAAADVLEERGLKGIFFVPTAVLCERRLLPAHAIHLLLGVLSDERFEDEILRFLREQWGRREPALTLDVNVAAKRMYHYEPPVRARLKYMLSMVLPRPVRNRLIEELFEQSFGSMEHWGEKWYLSENDVCDLQRRGHTIGAHGHSHEPLTRLGPADRQADLFRSARVLNEILGPAPRPLSYPYGAVDPGVAHIARLARFASAFTTDEKSLSSRSDRYRLPRIDTILVRKFDSGRQRPSPSQDTHGASVVPSRVASDTSPMRTEGDHSESEVRGLLERFLHAYWLRPENALWMTLRSMALSRCAWESPAADLCCGDGLFTFLHHGGLLDPAFDVFVGGFSADRSAGTGADRFDHVGDLYRPSVLTPPRRIVEVGSDLKPNLLEKARRLGVFSRLIEHDHERPLPLASESLRTIHCNAAYWLSNIDAFLADLRRVVHSDGRIILQVKLDSFRQSTLGRIGARVGNTIVDRIRGDRVEQWKSLTDRNGWERRFQCAHLKIESVRSVASAAHAAIWEVGLRPLAPLLSRMANSLTDHSRTSIKSDWVRTLVELAFPLCKPDIPGPSAESESVELQYELLPS